MQITNLINGTKELGGKCDPIEKLTAENLLQFQETDDVTEQFGQFWNEERLDAFQKPTADEKLKPANHKQ